MTTNSLNNLYDEVVVYPSSSPLAPNLQSEIEGYFKTRGLKVRYLLDPYENYGKDTHLFSAQSIEARLEALREELERDGDALILAARGGAGALGLLDNFRSIELAKTGGTKVFSGYSDFTALFEPLKRIEGVIPLHGPCFLSFRDEVEESAKLASFTHLESLILGEKTVIPRGELDHFRGPDDSVTGELIGGNLSIFCSLLGTSYDPDCSGKILFLEDVGEAPHRLHRSLTQLLLAGKFEGARAILLGSFNDCEHRDKKGPTIIDLFADLFDNSSIPVYRTASFGHQGEMRTIPVGVEGKISVEGLTLVNSLKETL